MSDYKQGLSTIPANQFMPNCCSSLVYAWFSAMKNGEGAGADWCQKAHQEPENSNFYASHIARNQVIQGEGRIAQLQRMVAANKIMMRQGFAAESYGLALAMQPTLDSLGSREQETRALSMLGFAVARAVTVNPKAALDSAIRSLGEGMRFYTIQYRAAVRSHVVGIISTKSEGWFSPGGWLYYYDPNLKCVVKFSSRDDLILFIDKTMSDYQGMSAFTTLRRT